MRTVAIVQARMNSSRLPGKVMALIEGQPMIALLLNRLRGASGIDEIVVATTDKDGDRVLADFVRSLGYQVFLGSDHDVLGRYFDAAKAFRAEAVVRITADCPLIDATVVGDVLKLFHESEADYCSNVLPPTFPDGLDVEVFTMSALSVANAEATTTYDREHVTQYIQTSDKFAKANYSADADYSDERWTVDEPEDLILVRSIFSAMRPNLDFSWGEILLLRSRNFDIFRVNRAYQRNQGSRIGSGNKLWQRAKRVIPGGNMILSKRPELYLPEQWPTYFKKASGCHVWDLDEIEYADVCFMGLGTNTLGYGHPEVDAAVRSAIDSGNLSTLNCPEEVLLAERLVELHPWAQMARFARTGGEANAVAVRIARAASGKDIIAFCGYHGWHDWYLSANLGNGTHLDGHLLPGLSSVGVPRHLQGSVLPFRYNHFDELEAIVASGDVGTIFMEVSRSHEPTGDFLRKVRLLASEKNIVLIFDECTSGFRESYGGLHLKYGVDPDMAIFGKALGNGYAITAVIGRREVMQAAQSTFISSTFWSERIGPAAALKTLEVMKLIRSWELITAIGNRVKDRWRAIASSHKIDIQIEGLAALAGFSFVGAHTQVYKTLLTQEMLARGFLASTGIYTSIAHNEHELESYFHAFDEVFSLIAKCDGGDGALRLLRGPIAHAGFSRLA